MKLNLWVDRSFCVVAIAHELYNGKKIKSYKDFKEAVGDYTEMFGRLCIDDHEGECSDFEVESEIINDKYYKH